MQLSSHLFPCGSVNRQYPSSTNSFGVQFFAHSTTLMLRYLCTFLPVYGPAMCIISYPLIITVYQALWIPAPATLGALEHRGPYVVSFKRLHAVDAHMPTPLDHRQSGARTSPPLCLGHFTEDPWCRPSNPSRQPRRPLHPSRHRLRPCRAVASTPFRTAQ